jgi:tetratricopeptide (TPR) repeat protein
MAQRFYPLLFVAIGVGSVSLQVASTWALRSSFWGFHLYAFLPLTLAFASWGLVLVGTFLFLWSGSSRVVAAFERHDRAGTLRPRRVVPLLLLVCGVSFSFLGSQQTVLGDAWVLVQDLPTGQSFHPRQPLTMALQQLVFRGASTLSEETDPVAVAQQSVAFVSVSCGLLFALVAYALAHQLVAMTPLGARPGTTRRTQRAKERSAEAGDGGSTPSDSTVLLVCLALVSQGYVQLFAGYLENYAAYALSLALFVYAALLHLRGRVPLLVPLLFFLLNLGVHLSAIALLPSVLFLCAWSLLRAPRRVAAVRDIVLAAVALLLLDRALASLSRDYSLWSALIGIARTGLADQGGGSGAVYLMSARHHRDFLNEQFLIGPLGTFLFVPACVFALAGGRLGSARLAFLAVVAGCLWLSSWATAEPALGYARDWDLFAPTAVVFTAAALAFLLDAVRDFGWRVRLLLFAVLISLLHTGSWLLVNHSEARSIERFAHLPLGLGRTEVVLGNWHWRNGRTQEALEWFEKALRINPRSNTAYSFLGIIYGNEGRMDLAAEAYRRAVEIRPDQLTYRANLIRALEARSSWEETLPHYDMLCRRQPYNVENWLGWGRALLNLGRREDARRVLERAVALYKAEQVRQPYSYESNTNVGALLAALDRHDEALPFFLRALEVEPASDNALYNIGAMHMALGRPHEARPYLQRLLEINPSHFRRDEVRAWLGSPGSN